MTAPLPVALPYGLRDVKLTPYTDALGTILGAVSVDLPNSQTFSFSEAEEFSDLRGDDKKVTTHGAGANVSWSLEAGGISFAAWKVLSGAVLMEEGVAPTRRLRMRKKSSDQRPYFRVEGQAISDSGGDMHTIVYRCRATGDLAGDFGDGNFFVSSASGEGLPLVDDANDLLYDFVQNEQKSAISLTPAPNPLPTPQNVQVGIVTANTVGISWDPVAGATGYSVEKAASPFSTWSTLAGTVTGNSIAGTGVSANTAYKFRVKAILAAGTSDPSVETGVITTPAS